MVIIGENRSFFVHDDRNTISAAVAPESRGLKELGVPTLWNLHITWQGHVTRDADDYIYFLFGLTARETSDELTWIENQRHLVAPRVDYVERRRNFFAYRYLPRYNPNRFVPLGDRIKELLGHSLLSSQSISMASFG